jgi:hypothetical protein
MGIILPIAFGVLITILVTTAVLRRRRHHSKVSELNQHPERLDQMLDPTDDA